MDAIFKTAGATGLYDEQPLQRAFRDFTAANQHITMMWDAQATDIRKGGAGTAGRQPDAIAPCRGLWIELVVGEVVARAALVFDAAVDDHVAAVGDADRLV